jgi:hypothetical protein
MRLALLLFFVCLTIALTAQPLINEFEPNPDGADPAMVSIELIGVPGESFTGFLSSIENDGINGTVDRVSAVSGTFDANGLLVVMIGDLENPSFTFVLSSADPGLGTDLDATNDGTIDDIPGAFGTVYDAIGIADNASDASVSYATQLGGTSFMYSGAEPFKFFRDTDGNPYIINSPTASVVFSPDGTSSPIGDFSPDPLVDSYGQPNSVFTDSALPVALTNLTAERNGKTAMVKWSTVSESGNSHFVIERSQDGRNFNEIGRINGSGNSYATIDYDFTDQAPASGDNFYRLRQVDLTGASNLYGPAMVSFERSAVTAYPNPVANRLFVSGLSENSRTTILDLNGKVMRTSLATGNGIATDGLPAGTYLLQIENAAGTETLRFVKQ